MVKRSIELFSNRSLIKTSQRWKQAIPLTVLFLLIEFFDELSFGVQGAVLPALRNDLGLTYGQIGLLFGAANLVSAVIEPFLMLLGDTRLRKILITGGGLAIVIAMLLTAGATSFYALLVAFILNFPATGAFVSLVQATLMDLNPGREPQMMARWTAAGSAGSLLGPLLVAGGFALAFGWRWAFIALAGMALLLVVLVWVQPFPRPGQHAGSDQVDTSVRVKTLWENLKSALRNRVLMRWLVLLELSDLLLDVFAGYLALYLTDVAGFTPAQASLVFGVVMAAGLAADLIAIPLLERFPGRSMVRVSAAFTVVAYAALLSTPWAWMKIALLVVLSFSTAGWYPVLQGEAYATIPGRSGTVMAVTSLGSLGLAFMAAFTGWVAGQAGLNAAMWLLILGPLSLAVFVPRSN